MMGNFCPRCCEPFDRGAGNGYCLNCHAEYMRNHRPKYNEMTDEQKWKSTCRSHSRMLVTRGQIKVKPCEGCGDPKVQRHHEDYDNPRLITFLCRECHDWVHEVYREKTQPERNPYLDSFHYACRNP